MEIKVFAKNDLALKGINDHYKETRKLKHRAGLGAWGVKHVLKDNVLTISLKGLIKMIARKGGSVAGVTEQMKKDLLSDIDKSMVAVGATSKDYEVVFNE